MVQVRLDERGVVISRPLPDEPRRGCVFRHLTNVFSQRAGRPGVIVRRDPIDETASTGVAPCLCARRGGGVAWLNLARSLNRLWPQGDQKSPGLRRRDGRLGRRGDRAIRADVAAAGRACDGADQPRMRGGVRCGEEPEIHGRADDAGAAAAFPSLERSRDRRARLRVDSLDINEEEFEADSRFYSLPVDSL